jgi:hypothetical protein
MRLLKDRTFFVLTLILCVIIILIAIVVYNSSNNGTNTRSASGFKIGENLTEQQKLLILNITMNDSHFKNELLGLAGSGLAYGDFNGTTTVNISDASGNYHIKSIYVDRYEDVSLHISDILPAVTFIVGDESREGPTLQAFVDPVKKRVVYVKETWRINPDNVHLFNKSFADTGYTIDEILTEEQQSAAINIALANESVKGYLDGKNYTLNGVDMSGYESDKGFSCVEYVYPLVTFYIKPTTMIRVIVDITNSKILGVDSEYVTPPFGP